MAPVLHHVIRDVANRPHAVNRHDARMLEPAGDLGLELKPLERPRIAGDPHRHHFQGDAPCEGWLLGLINDAHAAATTLVSQDATPDRANSRPPFLTQMVCRSSASRVPAPDCWRPAVAGTRRRHGVLDRQREQAEARERPAQGKETQPNAASSQSIQLTRHVPGPTEKARARTHVRTRCEGGLE